MIKTTNSNYPQNVRRSNVNSGEGEKRYEKYLSH
jgi:hypothetical protein